MHVGCSDDTLLYTLYTALLLEEIFTLVDDNIINLQIHYP